MRLWILFAMLLTLQATGAYAGDEPPPCATPIELSALSGTIVYEGDPPEGADPGRNFEVWVIGVPDWRPRLIAGGPGFDGHPTWSPDGSRIVYSSHGHRNPDLYLIDLAGGRRTQLTSDSGRDDYPIWTHLGIVYNSDEGRRVVDPDTGVSEASDLPPEIEAFALSPDRSQMVVVKGAPASIGVRHLYLADAHGRIERQLTNELPREIHPHWSPAGNRIAYSGGDGRRDGRWDVFVLDLDSGKRTQVTHNPGADWACGWSPDGQSLLITSEYGGNWDIYAIRPNGSDRLRITCHAGNARYAQWTAAEPLATK